jgi:hypothetical protein
MNENRNLQNGIGIQVGQIQVIEIKETAEKGGNRKSKTAEKKRNISNGFVGVLYWNSDPVANPPRTELLRRKNPDGYEMKEVGLGYNRHMVTCERQLAVGIDGGMTATDELEAFRLGAISTSPASGAEAESQKGREGLDARKQELGHKMWRRATMQYMWGFSWARYRFQKVPSHHPTIISKMLTSSDFTWLLPSKWPTRPVLTRLLPPKRRRRHQSLDRYL